MTVRKKHHSKAQDQAYGFRAPERDKSTKIVKEFWFIYAV